MLHLLQGHYMPVLAASAVYVAVGYAWYSEYLFGHGACKHARSHMHKKMEWSVGFGLHVLTSVVIVSALCVALKVFATANLLSGIDGFLNLFSWMFTAEAERSLMGSLKVVLFVWGSFFATQIAERVYWTGECLEDFLVHAGGKLAMLSTAAAVLFYFGC